MDSFDFAVIGGGSAGYAAAAESLRAGLRTVVIESSNEVGGLCILRGCMPSKTLLESANRFLSIRRAAEFGLSVSNPRFDMAAIRARKRKLVQIFADYRRSQLGSGKFDFIRARARFVAPDRLRLNHLDGSTSELSFRTALVATGSELNQVTIPGLAECGFLASDTALESDHVPKSIVLLGGGAIALEFAHFYNALGVKVTLLQRGKQVLTSADPDVAETVASAQRQAGVTMKMNVTLRGVERVENGKKVIFEERGTQQSVVAEEIFFALGRRPVTRALGLEEAGIHLQDDGSIKVNEYLQTSQPHVFAAGDVSSFYEIVHIAVEEGALACRNAARLLRSKPMLKMDYRLKLLAVFSRPEVAMVGLNEREAADLRISVRVARHSFDDHGKSIIRGETEGFVKLIVRADTGEIVGAAAVGPEVAELIHEVVVAMHFRATARELAAIPHYHPTLSEIWTYPAEELASLTNAEA